MTCTALLHVPVAARDLKWYSFATIMDEDFEFDPAKCAANHDKHGIDFVEAQALWSGASVERPLPYANEERHLRIGALRGKLWAAVFTLRTGRVRLISVRRARREEETEYARNEEGVGRHDHQP